MKKRLHQLCLILFISLFYNPANAQVKGFVAMDDSVKAMIEFYKVDTILVVLPDAYTIKESNAEAIENFVFWKDKPVYEYKHESTLQPNDFEKNIQFFGPVFKFRNKSLLDIPFGIEKEGFSYRERSFQKPEDAFYYMHPSGRKMYTCQNGDEHPLAYLGFLAGAYQLYIWSGNEIAFSGNEATSRSVEQINDMDALRENYFCRKINSQFFNLYFDCALSGDSISDTLGNELDHYVVQLCSFLNVDTVGLKAIDTYFYTEREELQYFIAAPLWQTIYGKSFGDINHITGFNLGTFKHETGHSIIGAKMGFNPYPFLMEGFRQSTDYFFSQDAYLNDLKAYKENADLLTKELVFSDNSVFFRGWVNYSISGVFIKYLVDRIGLSAFKEDYSQNKIEDLLIGKGYSIEGLIEDFKKEIN